MSFRRVSVLRATNNETIRRTRRSTGRRGGKAVEINGESCTGGLARAHGDESI